MPAGRCPGRQDLGQRTVGNQPEGRNSEIICVEFPGKHWGHIHTTFAPDPPLSTNQGAKMSTAKHNKNTNRNKRLAPEFWPDGHLCEGGAHRPGRSRSTLAGRERAACTPAPPSPPRRVYQQRPKAEPCGWAAVRRWASHASYHSW